MAQAEPLKLSEKIGCELSQFAKSVTHTDAYNRMEFKRLEKDCELLQKTEVVIGSLRRAFLNSAVGNYAEVDRWLKNAELNGGQDSARIERFTHFANHGLANDAFGLIEQVFKCRQGHQLMELARGAAAIGAFSAIVDAVKASQANGEVLQMTNLYALSIKATEVSGLLGVTGQDVAAMVNVAGEFLRDNRLLWEGELPDITVLDAEHGGPTLGIEFRIDVTPKHAVQLGWALTEQLIERGLDHPGVYVDFLGTQLKRQLAA